MKIQPIDFNPPHEWPSSKIEPVVKPAIKSRFKRLFERQFSSALRIPAPDKPAGYTEHPCNCSKDGLEEFEPSSVCLAKMVRNFIEENNEKPQQRCERKRCNCFNGNSTDSSDEESDSYNLSSIDACDLKDLVPCFCVSERNLLADTAKIVERNKISKHKDGLCRTILTDGLSALGYNASICKSKWEKSPSFPAGEYEYVDVVIEGERFIIDIDFRSEFEVARSTKAYRLVLQTLPNIFVGKSNRLEKIIDIVSVAAKQSLKKKGMPFPPWRKAEYVKAKWLSPFIRISPNPISSIPPNNHSLETQPTGEKEETLVVKGSSSREFDKIDNANGFILSNTNSPCEESGVKCVTPLLKQWEPPEIRPKSLNKGVKIVTGLASLIEDKP
ncbi:hypothetical protein CDL12_11459 [Handroanthus impetiginosus]|uniref:Uncharacterized protein n=1 Tax=Handroanthus impetiginosus TaxID=429701 RepID=A0A2G9HED8_9LAMI|nr:hypothetical protein CDL12_11459 [Handroanthus impetiginosus]